MSTSIRHPNSRVKKSPQATPVNLFEFESLARRRLPPMAWNYLAGGSPDENTLRRNRERLDALRLKPRVLVDVSRVDTRLELLGETLEHPILLAPAGYQCLFHPEGEIAAVRGAGEAGALFVASTVATTSIEDIGRAATGRLWFQLYVQQDRGFTRELVRRTEAAGCRALCLTVDTPTLGPRDRERRSSLALPPGLRLENLVALGTPEEHQSPFARGIYNPFLDPALTWEIVGWLRSFARVPLLLKGILAPEDARRAVESGADGVIVSNHGGRNLDTVPAAIEALPRVAEAVAGRVPLLMDGGVRRGTDIVKALALGAKAVLIGRPYLWGLAVGGADGVRQVVTMLRTELEMAMAMCGTPSLEAIGRRTLWDEE